MVLKPYLKNAHLKQSWLSGSSGRLPSKCEALNSNPSTAKKRGDGVQNDRFLKSVAVFEWEIVNEHFILYTLLHFLKNFLPAGGGKI
jgi:hypothetical protein